MSIAPSPSCPQVRLRHGREVPALGLGSWNLGQGRHPSQQEIDALQVGQQLGMRLIDTAEMYGNGRSEQLIGQAIDSRQPPYLVSKVLPSNASARGIARACEASLQRLGVRTLDLYLLHWRGGSALAEVVDAFEALRDAGKIRDWGVSNFDVDDMEDLWSIDGGHRCLVNQVLYHAGSRGIEFDLLPWCADHQVTVMAYSPLGSRALLGHPTLQAIGARRGVAATAVALAWAIRAGKVIAIPESGTPEHVRANAAACALQLDDDDLAELDRSFPAPTRKQPLDLL
ncbi:diketogulonate reductase-like aldo/keto reductase [Xanthomonas arboricola]|uniref:aldo/keto reductase n=1 Tax=Xanthomonas cannabis TaxID=1885674 RepID=UPI00160AA79E|nr:aldo/keto reductase [Xanthomonas cannabis]MBB3801463.1 diketogulonate reductase-like aldo/keto reductase [Xanthomonas cannabis]